MTTTTDAVAAASESTFHAFVAPAPQNVRPQVFRRREEIPKALLAAEATTYGWDTVNCIKAGIVNDVLEKSGQYPTNLAMVINPDENWRIDTNYGPWQIAPGGSGAILMMHLPLTSATLTAGTENLSFTGGSVKISIKLRYLPQTPPEARKDDQAPVDIEKLLADAQGRSADDPAVVIQRVDYGTAKPSEQLKALFTASVALLLNDNLAKFSHVFAVVNLNQKADVKEFFWLKPTFTSYAYFQGVDDDSSYFAVLNQTENRSPEGLTNQVAASAIPAGMNASVLISNTMFMRQFVMPGMPRAFPNADEETFKFITKGQGIESTKPVRLDGVKVAAVTYTPIMTNFRLQVVGDEIQIQTKVTIPISPGIVAYVDATYFYVLGLVKKGDGTMTLGFVQSSNPLVTTWYTVAEWVTITQLIVSIIGAVIGVVAGTLIEKVSVKIIVVVLITIVAGIAAATPAIIADVISNGAASALPAIGPLVDEATGPINWPKSSGFDLKTAELNGALQLGGMLVPSTDLDRSTNS
ncbi:TULIP family P47-like protein [Arthrobacter sp. SDTb3-6]|uniref:TULIP family P47-like protein n=1 Tax=Arthrobacter sp. SDTb3-6 TaxID=2713571 RepID=UPI00159E664E|nr:TULIP family P47-like protein [Arthrobacter sp. SDTb3-6]NVM97744.1 TULIP family P47-like protein [Arthrobacter sp. SDTb3-6]